MDAVHSLVPRAIAELCRSGPLSQGKLEVAWRAAVGDALCRVSKARLQPDGSVVVDVSDPRWKKEIQRSSTLIARRLNDLLGAGTVERLNLK
jgi:hypothetical protein